MTEIVRPRIQKSGHLRLVAAATLGLALTAPATAQQDNPVYVDDSPQARELLRQARDQTRENAGEAVRLYQELLDDFGLRLVPSTDAGGEQFSSTRQRVIAALTADQDLLNRYRLVQTPAAEQLLQNGELVKAAMSYTLTEPGLEAMLRLAQRELEAGRFHSSLGWLLQSQSHPDHFGRRAAHSRFMAALAYHDLGDQVAAQAQRDAMLAIEPEGRTFEQELARLIESPGPAIDLGVTTLDRGPEPGLTDVVPQAIWTTPLEDSLQRRRLRAVADNDDPANNNPVDARMRDADVATSSVTVVGPIAYINEGHTILALDRLTGREMWSYQDLSQLALTEPGGGLEAWDMSVVAAQGDTLITLTGHAQANRRSDSGRVICLDAIDGSLRWSAPLKGIIDAAADEELFPHGAPILMEGRVYVMARKVSSQLLTSAFVVALDAGDGSVVWTRYVAGSGGLRIAARPFDSLVAKGGALYVASAVGATARLEPATGEIRWLRRFNVPINTPISDQTRRPWEMTAPVVTDHGLVTLQPDSRRVVMLDLDTGDELANHSAATSGDWNSPRYLLTDGQQVYSVGSDIRCFRTDNLQEPIWRLPAPAVQQEAADEAPPVESLELRGRVQLAGDRLIAPAAEGVLVIDAVTGAVEQTLPIDATGNPMAYESQLLLAGSDRLDAYMSLRRAEELLRRQMAASPDAPEPALSLLRLGIRAGNTALALEAADLAMHATESHPDDPAFDARRFGGRAELFSLLLDLARTGRELTPEQGETVFARLQQAAIGPEQRVEHLLAYGDWLSNSALPRAIETWQTILSDQRLANIWLTDDSVARPAWVRAVDRIGKVIATRGASAYAPQSDFAALRLAQIRDAAAGATVEPEALLSLAREFPFAPAAIEAALQAGEIRTARGDTRGALGGLAQAYLTAPSKASASRLIGRFVEIAEKAGWTQQAREALITIRAGWGDIELESSSGTQRLGDRLADLGGARPNLPRLGAVSGEAVPLGAPIIRPTPTFSGSLPTDRVLLRDGNNVKLITSASIQPAWAAVVEGASPQILRFDDQAIILWFGADQQNPRAVRLNPADGTVVWTTSGIAELFTGGGGAQVDRTRVAREQMPNGDSYDPGETIALAHRQSLILVQRTGAIAAIDIADGSTVRWTAPAVLQQVHLALERDGVLVLTGTARDIDAVAPAGRDRAEADAQQAPSPLSPRIQVVDPDTGRPAFGVDGLLRTPGRGGVKWMTVSALGTLVYGTTDGIDAADLTTGERRWSNASIAALDSQRAWPMTSRVVFEDQRSRLRSINLSDGLASDTFELPLRGEWDPMEMRDLVVADDTAIAHYRQRIVIFDAETGRVAGADAVPEDRDFRWLVVADGLMLAVSHATTQPQVNPGGIRRTQYQYSAYPLSMTGKLLGPPIRTEPLAERAQQVTAIDGWLLYSMLTDTLAVPMSGK